MGYSYLKDKKGIAITNEIWVNKGSEFYNRSMQSWPEKNDVEMY